MNIEIRNAPLYFPLVAISRLHYFAFTANAEKEPALFVYVRASREREREREREVLCEKIKNALISSRAGTHFEKYKTQHTLQLQHYTGCLFFAFQCGKRIKAKAHLLLERTLL